MIEGKKHKLKIKRKRVVIEERELEAEEGDLVMLIFRKMESGEISSVCQGVFGGFEEYKGRDSSKYLKEKQGVKVIRPFYLGPSETLGRLVVPTFKPRNGGDYRFEIRGDIEIYLGKTEITEKLREMPGFEWYASWVSNLEKPYVKNDGGNQEDRD